MVDQKQQMKTLRTKRHLFQPLGMGTHPQIALTVGEGRMYLVGKTPVLARHAVVKRTQAVVFTIEIRKTSSIRMHPQHAEDVFMDMESRT